MRFVMMAAGVCLLVLGLHWIGQGTGLFIWPSNPEMDYHTGWAWFGLADALVGTGVIVRAIRMRPSPAS